MLEKPKVTTRRRNYEKDAETRELLIDTAVEILRTSGFNDVSARKVATKAGLSHQIVHYYFQSMEELLLVVIERASVNHLEAIEAARNSEQPLWEVWHLINKRDSGRLEMEYLAIASRYSRARSSIKQLRTRYREQLIALLAEAFERHDLETGSATPSIVSMAVHSIARTMALEAAHGTTEGHGEIKAFIENHILKLEGPYRADL